jgi:outer membrane protein, heavy metal efflux system
MRRNQALAAIFICVVPFWLAQGQEGRQNSAPNLLREAAKRPPMQLKDFESLALANNPTLRQAGDVVQRSAAQARQAGLYPNPSVGYEGSEIRGGSFGGGENGAFVQQTIVLGGKLGLRKHVFQAQQREDEAGVNVQRYRLLGDVDQRFYSALAAEELVRLRRGLLNIARDAMETARQLANVGQADMPDVLQAEVEAEQAGVDYTTAQMNYLRVFEALAATAGTANLPISPLKGDLSQWPQFSPNVIDNIVRDSPAVKRAEEAVARAEVQLRSAKREAIPDLQLQAGVQQDSEALNEAARRLSPVGVIGLASARVSLPIFNRNQGNVAAASADLARARDDVTRVQLSLRRTIARLLRDYWADQNQADQYRTDMIPEATCAYRLYLNDYRHMAAAYPEVLVSQRTLFQLQVGYVQALDHLWQNAIALQNFGLTDGLKSPTASGTTSSMINLPGVGTGSGE